MFSVTSQLNWLHKVLSFICQGSKPELSVAFRSGTMYYNGFVSFHLRFFNVIIWKSWVVNIIHFTPFLKKNILEARLFGPMFCKEEIIATLNFNVSL